MKWFKWIVGVVLVLVFATAGYAISRAYRAENPVGFQAVRVETGSGPIAVAIWYPTSAAPQPTTFIGGALMSVAKDGPVQGYQLPVVVMSHGNNGSATSHVDLAMDLASAGYVVAAPTHTGDNYADQSRQSSPALFSQRAEQLRSTMDYVLKSWTGATHVDGGRVGAYGMSAGGFTVLTLAGATPRPFPWWWLQRYTCCEELLATIDSRNLASERLLLRLGFDARDATPSPTVDDGVFDVTYALRLRARFGCADQV